VVAVLKRLLCVAVNVTARRANVEPVYSPTSKRIVEAIAKTASCTVAGGARSSTKRPSRPLSVGEKTVRYPGSLSTGRRPISDGPGDKGLPGESGSDDCLGRTAGLPWPPPPLPPLRTPPVPPPPWLALSIEDRWAAQEAWSQSKSPAGYHWGTREGITILLKEK